MPITMARKKPDRTGRARERGETVPFMFEMAPELAEALDECARAEMRTKRAVLTLALYDYLAARGLWPAREGGER
jgi:predicted transcriptional regulator